MQLNLYKEEENMDLEKNSVERTLCIPLWSRAIAVKKLPDLLPDQDPVQRRRYLRFPLCETQDRRRRRMGTKQ